MNIYRHFHENQFTASGIALLHENEHLRLGTAQAFIWEGRSRISSPVNGDILVANESGTDFRRLLFAGPTIAIGRDVIAAGGSAISIGDDARVSGLDGIAIGVNSRGLHGGVIAIGNGALASGNTSIAIGSDARVGPSGTNSIAIGSDARSHGKRTVSIGPNAIVSEVGYTGIALGYLARCSHKDSVVIGPSGQTFAPNQIMLGKDHTVVASGEIQASGGIVADTIQISGINVGDFLSPHTVELFTQASGVQLSDHGQLNGLADDDHTQYLLVDGTRPAQAIRSSGGVILDKNQLIYFGPSGSTSRPALKGAGTELQIRRADDTTYANLRASSIFATNDLGLTNSRTIYWDSRSQMSSPVNGDILLENNSGGNFTKLMLGGTGSNRPALKRNGAHIQFRRADDSDYCNLEAGDIAVSGILTVLDNLQISGIAVGNFLSPHISNHGALSGLSDDDHTQYLRTDGTRTATGNITTTRDVIVGTNFTIGWTNRSVIKSPGDGHFRFTNASGTDCGRIQLGGSTDEFPAIERNGANIAFKTAVGGSSWTTVLAGKFESKTGGFVVDDDSPVEWKTRSKISSPGDGDLTLSNQAGNDFNLLRLGGDTSAEPAIKREGTSIAVKLADNSGFANLIASGVILVAPNGSGWTVVVDDAGNLSTTGPVAL